MRLLFTTALVLGVASTSALAGSFTSLDNAENGFLSALSRNGRIASGVYVSFGQYSGSFAWREGAGETDIPFGSVIGMNSWAQPMVGADVDADGYVIAAMAYSDLAISGPVPIGPYPGSNTLDNFYSQAYGVSDDGVVVGLAYDPSLNPIAFRWTKTGGMTRLAVNRPTTYSRANGISADGGTIFGWNDQFDGYRRGVIWIDGKPVEPHDPGPVGDDFGAPPGEALGTNASGSVVVGQGYWNDLPSKPGLALDSGHRRTADRHHLSAAGAAATGSDEPPAAAHGSVRQCALPSVRILLAAGVLCARRQRRRQYDRRQHQRRQHHGGLHLDRRQRHATALRLCRCARCQRACRLLPVFGERDLGRWPEHRRQRH